MSDLGEISAELNAALGRLARAANRFAELDRSQLAPLQAELSRTPGGERAAALIARARALVRQAEAGATAARGAGAGWLSQHGSGEAGGSGASPPIDGGGAGAGGFLSAAAQAASELGVATPGGRAYFGAGETQARAFAVRQPPFDGEYTLIAHGDSEAVYVGEHELGAAELAELIRSDPDWGGRPVRLLSCNTGRGKNPLAEQLAEQLGVEVTAPDDFAWFGAWTGVAPAKVMVIGGEEVTVPDRDNQGSWRVFAPGKRR